MLRNVVVVDERNGFRLAAYQEALFDTVIYSKANSLDQLRNESLLAARRTVSNGWALVIDSDEFVDAHSLAVMREALATTSIHAFQLPVFNYFGRGRWATTYAYRLFRLDAPIEYRYRIHESIAPSLADNALCWDFLYAPIHHLDFIEIQRGKREKYLAMLNREIEEGQDLPFLLAIRAVELFAKGANSDALTDIDSAIGLAMSCRSRLEGKDDFPRFLQALFLLKLGAHADAYKKFLTLFERARSGGSARARLRAAESALGLASVESSKGSYRAALEWAESSIALWPSAEGLFNSATLSCLLGNIDFAFARMSEGLSLNGLAADTRVLCADHPETLFDWQSLLVPQYAGSTALAQRLRSVRIASPRVV